MSRLLDLPWLMAITFGGIFFLASFFVAQIPNWAVYLGTFVFAIADFALTKVVQITDVEKNLLKCVGPNGISRTRFHEEVKLASGNIESGVLDILMKKHLVFLGENSQVRLTWLGRHV